MSRIIALLVICGFFSSFNAQTDKLDFWDRVNVGVQVGPIFPSGDETDFYNLSTGYYVGLDARYELYRFMAVGVSIGTNAWNGDTKFDYGDFGFNQNNSTDICSRKTNFTVSLRFGPSAPTWTDVTKFDVDISDVRPYPPGMIVPFFILDVGPYLWSWTEESDFGSFDESGSDMMIRGTVAGFYQMTKLLSLTLGFSYTMYDFDADFTATGIFAGARVNVGQLTKE